MPDRASILVGLGARARTVEHRRGQLGRTTHPTPGGHPGRPLIACCLYFPPSNPQVSDVCVCVCVACGGILHAFPVSSASWLSDAHAQVSRACKFENDAELESLRLSWCQSMRVCRFAVQPTGELVRR